MPNYTPGHFYAADFPFEVLGDAPRHMNELVLSRVSGVTSPTRAPFPTRPYFGAPSQPWAAGPAPRQPREKEGQSWRLVVYRTWQGQADIITVEL